jgi:hypothetical protein
MTAGPLERTLAALKIAAPSPHWRNTWIFVAGALFFDPKPFQHDAVISLIEGIDNESNHRLGRVVPIGPRLALDLVDDGMTRSKPRWRDRLAIAGLDVLRHPTTADFLAVARIIVRFADGGDDQRSLVADAIRHALGGSPVARQTTARLQGLVRPVCSQINARAVTQGLSGVRAEAGARLPATTDVWQSFDDELDTSSVAAAEENALQAVRTAVRDAASGMPVQPVAAAQVREALTLPGVASALTLGLEHVAGEEPQLIKWLRDHVLEPEFRAAVGERLRAAVLQQDAGGA